MGWEDVAPGPGVTRPSLTQRFGAKWQEEQLEELALSLHADGNQGRRASVSLWGRS